VIILVDKVQVHIHPSIYIYVLPAEDPGLPHSNASTYIHTYIHTHIHTLPAEDPVLPHSNVSHHTDPHDACNCCLLRQPVYLSWRSSALAFLIS
jgi:hypothetical protein